MKRVWIRCERFIEEATHDGDCSGNDNEDTEYTDVVVYDQGFLFVSACGSTNTLSARSVQDGVSRSFGLE